jgi:uncharacterized ParB-like nuclease family protein/transcriptional regulator with XRE-family HTH domain
MPVDTIEIKRIAMNAGTQSRESISEEAVADYFEVLEAEGDLPPVTVYFDGLDYYLADGFHRILAYKRAERAYVDADVKGGTARDAIKYALQANAEHGLRRTSADKRKAVNMALDDGEWGKLTAREIARLCKVSHTFVNNVLKDRQGVSKPKEKPAKLKNVVEAPLEVGENPKSEVETFPPEDDMVKELIAENERLQDRLAVGAMDASEDERAMAQETIDELRQQVRNLTIELEAVKKSRDQYQMECSQLKKQVGMYQRQLKK